MNDAYRIYSCVIVCLFISSAFGKIDPIVEFVDILVSGNY